MGIINIDFLKPEGFDGDLTFDSFCKKYNAEGSVSDDIDFGYRRYRFYFKDLNIVWYYRVDIRDVRNSINYTDIDMMVCDKAKEFLDSVK